MHTCPPPVEALKSWLDENGTVRGRYGHLLLEQKVAKSEALINALRPYFESAHLDARQHFHNVMGIDLHPDAGAPGAGASYPNCLPESAIHGIFGEAIAGLISESYDFVGEHEWAVPVFLFRFHADVEKYLFDLSRNPERQRAVFGRFGSDFLALCLSDEGVVVRFLAGEAKWRNSLTPGAANALLFGKKIDDPEGGGEQIHSGKGIWFELNRDTPVPHGLRQLQQLLIELAPDGYAEAIVSLDSALSLDNPGRIPRTDLVLLTGNGGARREPGDVLVDWESAPAEYTAGNDLQVVELIFTGGDELIDELYHSLWAEDEIDAEA